MVLTRTTGPYKAVFGSESPRTIKNGQTHTRTHTQTSEVSRIPPINEAVNEIVTDVWWRGERRCGGDGGELEEVGWGGANEVKIL